MNRMPLQTPPRWWSPKLSPGWIRLWRPVQRRVQRRGQRLVDVEVRGAEHLRRAAAAGQGVLITPNHSAHADCHALLSASEQTECPFYFMVAWQVFQRGNWFRRLAFRHYGCFSVDREGRPVPKTILEASSAVIELLWEHHLDDVRRELTNRGLVDCGVGPDL